MSNAKLKPFPAEFNAEFYRKRYPDLGNHNDGQIATHYTVHGRGEGRLASPAAMRVHFIELTQSAASILEIGPFGRPCVRGANVRYFDVLDQAALKARAAALNQSVKDVPSIDYVEASGDLSVVGDSFAAVVSSHCVEHQPDLVYHLQQVERILEPGGCYFLLVPNKLYCFDHFIAESTLAEILAAHRNRARVHRLESVIEHRALTTHNDPARHWKGDHADPTYWDSIPSRTQVALAEFDAANGAYIDVHAWQFAPASFRRTIQQLNGLELTRLQAVRVFDTPYGSNEFTAILQKPA